MLFVYCCCPCLPPSLPLPHRVVAVRCLLLLRATLPAEAWRSCPSHLIHVCALFANPTLQEEALSKSTSVLEASQAKLEAEQQQLKAEREWLTEQQRTLTNDQSTLAAWRNDQVGDRVPALHLTPTFPGSLLTDCVCVTLTQAAAIEELGSRDAELAAQKAALDERGAELEAWAEQVRAECC